MSDALTLEAVHAIVLRVLGKDADGAGPDTSLTEGGFGLDSVRLLRTILTCEQTFGVVFDPDRDFTPEALATTRTLFALIRSKRPG